MTKKFGDEDPEDDNEATETLYSALCEDFEDAITGAGHRVWTTTASSLGVLREFTPCEAREIRLTRQVSKDASRNRPFPENSQGDNPGESEVDGWVILCLGRVIDLDYITRRELFLVSDDIGGGQGAELLGSNAVKRCAAEGPHWVMKVQVSTLPPTWVTENESALQENVPELERPFR
ncbi:hypothetical protein BJV74DRAFT_909041 [Russula compacta]|nr:hypothetical protein BJV74DRAFT_909041 [Russula compacta]